MDVSIVIIVKNRHKHLQNVLIGLHRATSNAHAKRIATETIIIHMNEECLPKPDFFDTPYLTHSLRDENKLPLARARNTGAKLSNGQVIIFLDVDCIPSINLISDFYHFYKLYPDAIAMGSVYYLSKSLDEAWDEQTLVKYSYEHPNRTYLSNETPQQEFTYELFWSLSFALSKETFDEIDGFDEAYVGYGAEDTDFAQKMKLHNKNIYWIYGAKAYHQPHPTCDPPLQHFEDIITNSTIFKEKWGNWPMVKWLKPFNDKGLINWNERSPNIELKRYPTEKEIQLALT